MRQTLAALILAAFCHWAVGVRSVFGGEYFEPSIAPAGAPLPAAPASHGLAPEATNSRPRGSRTLGLNPRLGRCLFGQPGGRLVIASGASPWIAKRPERAPDGASDNALPCKPSPANEPPANLTYMYAKPAWNRKQISLKAALIPQTWFSKRECSNKPDAGNPDVHRDASSAAFGRQEGHGK